MTYRIFGGGDGYLVQQDVSGEISIATTSPGQVICDYIVASPAPGFINSILFNINCVGGGADGAGSAKLSGSFMIDSSGIITRVAADDNTTKAFNSNVFSLNIATNNHIQLVVTQTSATQMRYRFQLTVTYDDNVFNFTSTSLSLTGFWQANFSASPWTGTASTGTSGSNNLSEATHPPTTGTTVSGFIPAHFNGTNQLLTATGTLATYYTISALTMICLIKINSFTAADPGASLPYAIAPLLGGTAGGNSHGGPVGGVCGSGSNGVFRFGQFDGAWKSAAIAVSTGSWMMLVANYDGTHMNVSVNNGTPVQTTIGSSQSLSSDGMGIGTNSSGAGGGYQAIDMLVGITSSTSLSATNITKIYNSFKYLYPGCSLP